MANIAAAPCSTITCPNGNCIGCRGGNLWCQDPRCAPNCPGCQSNNSTWSVIVIIFVIIIGLILIGAVIWIYWRSRRPAKLTPIYPTSPAQLTPIVSPVQLVNTTKWPVDSSMSTATQVAVTSSVSSNLSTDMSIRPLMSSSSGGGQSSRGNSALIGGTLDI